MVEWIDNIQFRDSKILMCGIWLIMSKFSVKDTREVIDDIDTYCYLMVQVKLDVIDWCGSKWIFLVGELFSLFLIAFVLKIT